MEEKMLKYDQVDLERRRAELLRRIQSSEELSQMYVQLSMPLQKQFVDFCLGMRGLPLTYDPFFKMIFHPENHPERLSRLLSLLLGFEVKLKRVLMNDGSRILEKGSLVIMDIVVELADGTIANVEIQKIPYRFPGERAACYSSDLVMRQYVRAKSEEEHFAYKNLKKVYTIVLLEKSTGEFHAIHDTYIHRASQKFDTGLKMNLLQEYVFAALDMFREIKQNKIEEELDAWLYCITSDDPEVIKRILTAYPEFASIYKEIEEFRQDPGGVLFMFSEALKILDHNTEQYMIEELQEEVKEVRQQNDDLQEKCGEWQEMYGDLQEENGDLREENGDLREENGNLREQIDEARREADENRRMYEEVIRRLERLEKKDKVPGI